MSNDRVLRTVCTCGSASIQLTVFGYDDQGTKRIMDASCECFACRRVWSPEIIRITEPKEIK